MSLIRRACNELLPLKNNERRIGKDSAEVLFTKSYVATLGDDERDRIDFDRVSRDLADEMVLSRARRVERVARPIAVLAFTGLAAVGIIVGIETVKSFPGGTYDVGPITVRTGDDAEKQPPLCISVEDDYLTDGFSMKLLGDLDDLQSELPIENTCRKFDEVFVFSESE